MLKTKWHSKYYTAKFMGYVTKVIIRGTLISLNKYIRKCKILERKWAKYSTQKTKSKEASGVGNGEGEVEQKVGEEKRRGRKVLNQIR